MRTEIKHDGLVIVSDIIDGQYTKEKYLGYPVSECVLEFAKKHHNFKVHGSYTISNSIGLLVEVSDCGDGARTLYTGDKPELTEWSEVEYKEVEGSEEMEPVFDAGGYEVKVGLVMRM